MNETPLYPNPHHPDDPAKWDPILKKWSYVRKYEVPEELQKLMWSGKLSQICPYCQHIEPAGVDCHKCGRQVTPTAYFKQQSLDADGKPRRGRPSKKDILEMVGSIANANA